MSADLNPPARVEMCANRFELISRWGEPLDWEWARAQLEAWLRSRVDLTEATVYDSGVQAKGTDHG
jgi:hypothetical protein